MSVRLECHKMPPWDMIRVSYDASLGHDQQLLIAGSIQYAAWQHPLLSWQPV